MPVPACLLSADAFPYLNSLICPEDLLAAWCLALQTGRTTYTSCIPAQLLLIQAVLLLPYILSDVVHCHLTVAVSCHSAESQHRMWLM